MKILRIKETCLYVRDLKKAHEFYHDKLELPVIHYLEDKHLFLRVGQSVLLLFNADDSRLKKSPPPHYGGGKQHFAFEVDSLEYEKYKSWILSKHIQIIDEVAWKNAKSFYFLDPEENVLEILPDGGVWD